MGVVAKDSPSRDFPNPPTGMSPALCVDVIDLGEQETPFKDEKTGKNKSQHQIQVVWQIHPEDEEGNIVTRTDGIPFRISRFYNLSLNEKATLRKDLESWRGKPFTEEELKDGFDVEKLLKIQCNLNLIEKPSSKNKDKMKVVVAGVSPRHRRDPEIEAHESFVREMFVPGGRDMRSPPAEDGGKAPKKEDPEDVVFEDDDDDLPF